MSLPKDQYSLANVLDVIDTSDSEFEGFEGGIDLLNMCTNLYKYNIKSRRWYMYIFFHSLTLALVNSWFLYRRYHQEVTRKGATSSVG